MQHACLLGFKTFRHFINSNTAALIAVTPTGSARSISGFSLMLKLYHAAHETALHFCHHIASALLPPGQVEKLPIHGLTQLAEGGSANRFPHRHTPLQAGLHQSPSPH